MVKGVGGTVWKEGNMVRRKGRRKGCCEIASLWHRVGEYNGVWGTWGTEVLVGK